MATLTATTMPSLTTARGFNLVTQFGTTSLTYVDVTTFTLSAVAVNDELAFLWAGHIANAGSTADARIMDSAATTTFIQLHVDTGSTAGTYVSNSGKGIQSTAAATDIKGQLKCTGGGLVYYISGTGITALNSGVKSLIITGNSYTYATLIHLKYSLKTVYGFTAGQDTNYYVNVLGMNINPNMVDGETLPSQEIDTVTDGGIFVYCNQNHSVQTQIIFDGGTQLEVTA